MRGFAYWRLRPARQAQGLTQADLAKLLGISSRSIVAYENGTSSPRMRIYFELSDIIKWDLEYDATAYAEAAEKLGVADLDPPKAIDKLGSDKGAPLMAFL